MPRLVSRGNLWNDRVAAGFSSRFCRITDDRLAAQELPEGRSLDGNYKWRMQGVSNETYDHRFTRQKVAKPCLQRLMFRENYNKY
jgi:hypothetical protein